MDDDYEVIIVDRGEEDRLVTVEGDGWIADSLAIWNAT